MARVVITIEDTGPNGVRVVSEPNFETMMKMDLSGIGLTSAHGYALRALNAIRESAKSSRLIINVPRVKRLS